MAWRIYYDDGSAYPGSTDQDAVKAPTIGVQVIWNEGPKSSGIIHGRDMYTYKGGKWWTCDQPGFYDYMFHYPGPKAVLFGRTMPTWEEYNDIVQKAKREKLGVQ